MGKEENNPFLSEANYGTCSLSIDDPFLTDVSCGSQTIEIPEEYRYLSLDALIALHEKGVF